MPKGVSADKANDKRKNNSRPSLPPELLKKNWTVRVTGTEKIRMQDYLRKLRGKV